MRGCGCGGGGRGEVIGGGAVEMPRVRALAARSAGVWCHQSVAPSVGGVISLSFHHGAHLFLRHWMPLRQLPLASAARFLLDDNVAEPRVAVRQAAAHGATGDEAGERARIVARFVIRWPVIRWVCGLLDGLIHRLIAIGWIVGFIIAIRCIITQWYPARFSTFSRTLSRTFSRWSTLSLDCC